MLRLALTYSATASTAAAAWVGLGQGQARIAGAVLVLAALAALARLHIAGVRIPPPSPRSAAVFAVSFLVVSGMMIGGVNPGGSAVGTAEAASIFQDCDLSDSIVGAFLQGIVAPNEEGQCRFNPNDNTDYQNISATDAYQQAAAIEGSSNRYINTYDNFAQDSSAIAASKAKIEIINALNNGSSEALAKSKANEAINEYYARMQKNIIADYNAKLAQINYLRDTPVTIEANGAVPNQYINDSTNRGSYTLVNGTTENVYVLRDDATASDDSMDGPVTATHPDTGDSVTMVDWPGDVEPQLSTIDSEHQRLMDNMDAFVSGVYGNYTAGEIDSTDLAEADPGAIAYQAGTDANSTGYYGYAAIQLASLGASGNINHSHTVEILDENNNVSRTVEGTLYYTGDDVTTFENNTVYNHTNLNGVVYMAAADSDGTTAIMDLGAEGPKFRITEAVNTQTGEAVNNTTVEQKTYSTFNATRLDEEIQKLRDLRESYETIQSSGGSGGIGFGGDSTVVIVLVVLAAAILLSRN